MHLTLAMLVFALAAMSSSISIGALRSDDGQREADKLECMEIDEELVSIVPHGFFLAYLNEFVPQDEVTPSNDGRYWRCVRDGQLFSFFVPPERY